jgi:transposase
MDVAVGIDSHKSSLAVAGLDSLGRVVASREFPNDERGHAGVLAWVRSKGESRVIGVESSGSYGAGIARYLMAAGEDVKEVPAFASHRERRTRPSKGKSDVADAVAIARVVARGEGLASPVRLEVFQDLKMLVDQRDHLVHARTQLINRTHRDLVVSHPGYEARIPKLNSRANQTAALVLLRRDRSVRANLIRDRIADIRRLEAKVAAVEKSIGMKLEASGSTLTDLRGIGPVLAAKFLGEVGDPGRLRSKAAFAMWAGTAPLEASSGTTKRHRLNRGGNRQLNYALYMMALARLRTPETQAYMAQQRAEGKSKREAMRKLKRHLANTVYRRLVADFERLGDAA